LTQTFNLSSVAGANQTIYLDFDGNITTGTAWNSTVASIVTPEYNTDATAGFSNNELTAIQQIWQRVAEDFSPFNVNVTTKAPTDLNDLIKTNTSDTRWGVRVAIGGSSSDWFGSSAGGVAYLNSFNWNSDTPIFAFTNQLGNGNEKYTAEAISHEVGHSLGLNHDGRSNPVEGYYQGQGSGETGWAPILGAGYYQNLTQWSKGEYAAANNLEDDLQIITSNNGFGYKVDDAGNTIATAKALTITGTSVSGNGIIERNTDADVYSFVAGAGAINLNINPAARGANLDILAELYSADGTLIASSNPLGGLAANISTTLATAGNYYLKIDGVGEGSPLVTGYTDYGSLGQYSITGDIVSSSIAAISLAVSPATVLEDGATNLVYTFSRTGDITNALTVNYNVNSTATLGSDYTQTGADTFADTAGTITFIAGASTAILTIDPTADTLIEGNETIALTLVSNPNYIVTTPAAAIGTIINDDIPSISLAVSPATVQEDGTVNLLYTFSRTGDTTNTLSVNYNVAGTATFGTDYSQIGANSFNSNAGTMIFAAGASTATLAIDPTADTIVENNETVALTLATGSNYAVATPAAVTGTIVNDDITVLPVISLGLSPTSVLEDGTANMVYTFSRTGNTTNALTVNYQVGGTATFNTDYTQIGASSFTSSTGKIAFAAGATTATLTIDPKADTTRENNETVGVTLLTNSNYTLGTIGTVSGTILDDDTPVITLAVSPASVLEDGTANAIYTFSRTGNIATTLTVKYSVGGTATLTNDYTQTGAATFSRSAGTITFAANSNTATLTIDPKADTTLETDETVAVTITANSAYTVGTTAAVVATILNDELAATAPIGFQSQLPLENATMPTAMDFAQASNIIADLVQGLAPNAMDFAQASAVIADLVQGLSLNLTTMVLPTTQITFTVEREAAYNNAVGFYRTLDAEGSIQSAQGILKPTDAGYVLAALQNALTNATDAGLNLAVENHGTAKIAASLDNSFYMPILVANSTLANAANSQQLTSVYTAFAGANADKTEHIRSLGNNTFGFEDMYGGGDRDFNDAIVKVSIG
jgi:Domain of unknown function (DUF4114)/Metallo-peptidase family M12B Reprolysin-like/Calx-beta domain